MTLEAIHAADQALLASLGYKQEFKRAFTPIEVFGIAFSNIGLLPSIASVIWFSLSNGAGPSMVWGWAAASVFVLCEGLAMGELASAAPTSGGLYFWTHTLASPRWRNILAWIVGYMNTIGLVSGVASVDWGCAVQVMAAATIGSKDQSFSPTNAQTFAVYAAIVLSHVVICSLGTTVLARLQNFYIAMNVLLVLAIIIALPIVTPPEFKNSADFALGKFINLNGWSNGFAFLMGLAAPLWSIAGFDASVHISEEASNAAVAVPWGIVLAIAISGVLGWAINMALAFCMGTDIATLANSDQPMALIFFNGFGQRGTLAIWAAVVCVQYMMGTSLLLAASRQTFAFSRDRALPLSSWLYKRNGYGIPVNPVIFDAFWAILLGVLSFAGDDAINAVFTTSIIAQNAAYALPIACRFLGNNDFKPGPFYLGRWGLPIGTIAVVFMLFMNIVFLFPTSPQTDVQDMNYTVVVVGGIMALSLFWYYIPRYGGVNWFTGPVPTIESPNEKSSMDELDKDVSLEEVKAVTT